MLKKISLYFFLTYLVAFWGFVTPLFEFPDEQVHLETVNYVADHGTIPGDFTSDVTVEMYRTQELLGTLRSDLGQNKYTYHPEYRLAYTNTLIGKYEDEIKSLNTPENRQTYVKLEGARYPIAYYLYSSYWHKAVESYDLITRSFIIRLDSLPLAILIVYYVYQTGMLIFGRRQLALTLVSMVFLQPMFSFLTAGVNSDNLHNLLFFALIYYCLRLVKYGLSWKVLVTLLIISALDIMTKTQGYLTVPFVALAVLLSLLRNRQWRVLTAAFSLFVIFLFFTVDKWLGFLISANNRGASFTSYLSFSANKLLAQNVVWFWGVFEWLGVVLPPIYWQVANRVVLLSVTGFAVYCWKVWKKKKIVADPYLNSYTFCTVITYTIAIFWADWLHHKNFGYSLGVQARYFFPILVSAFSLLLTGILSLAWHERQRVWLRKGVILLFLWLQLGGIWRLLTSYYTAASLSQFVLEISQYKPFYLKGSWWYLWIGIYLTSLLCLAYENLKGSQMRTTVKRSLAKRDTITSLPALK